MMKMNTSVQPINNEIIHIASSLENAVDKLIPDILLKLKDVLSRAQSLPEKEILYDEIWKFQFPISIEKALHQDFNVILGGWRTACQLAVLCTDCFIASNSTNMKDDFLQKFLSTLLQIITKITKEYINTEKILQVNLRNHVSSIITTILSLVEKFKYLSSSTIMSKHFMQFLMTEDTELVLLVLSFLKSIITSNRSTFDHVPESRVHNISDELAFKLSSTNNLNVARVSTEALYMFLEAYRPLAVLFSSKRYRGFKTYMLKWKGQGFDLQIDMLMKILDSQTEESNKDKRLDDAAIIIQSVFRGYKVRKNRIQASKAISDFQKTYRQKRIEKEKMREKLKLQNLKKETLEKTRRKVFLRSKQKQFEVIKDIPASTVEKFYTELQNNSARKIQAAWRGVKIRSKLSHTKPQLERNLAAIKIQRQVRKWLLWCRKQKQEKIVDYLPDGLTDTRRIELQKLLGNINEKFQRDSQSEEEFKENHEKAFNLLSNHMLKLRQMRRSDQHRKALLAQLSIQSEQMSSMPKFQEVKVGDVESYSSYSTACIVKARQKHLDTLNSFKKSWWEKLDSDNDSNIEIVDDSRIF